MSRFVEVEWFGRHQKIGIVLTHDVHDGFKVRMAPLPEYLTYAGEILGAQWVKDNAAKIPFEWAWGIFGKRMVAEMENATGAEVETVRYDGEEHKVKPVL